MRLTQTAVAVVVLYCI